MRKRSRIAIAMMVFAPVGFILWLLWPDGPYYKGKPLSYWLRGYDYSLYRQWQGPTPPGLSPNSSSEASQAVRELGTNAIPVLCKLILAQDSKLRLELRVAMQNSKFQPFFVKHGFLAPASPGFLRQREGFEGLYALGTNAVGAVPTLIEIIERPQFNDRRIEAIRFLTDMGPGARDAVPALIHLATNSPPKATNVVWTFYIVVDDPQVLACYALSQIRARPDLTVPALVRCLRDPEKRVRFAALQCIGAFGKDAQSAVPALFDVINCEGPSSKYSDGDLRDGAALVLQKIAPDVAAKLNLRPQLPVRN